MRQREVEFEEKLFGPVYECLDGTVRVTVSSFSTNGGKTFGPPQIRFRGVNRGSGTSGKNIGISHEVYTELQQKGAWAALFETLADATDRWSVSRYNPENQGGTTKPKSATAGNDNSVAVSLLELQAQVQALTQALAEATAGEAPKAKATSKKKASSTKKKATAAAAEADPLDW